MKAQIVDHIIKNKLRLNAETASIRREFKELLAREVPDFHDIIRSQYKDKIKSHVIRDLSMNLSIDYETSTVELDDVDVDLVLNTPLPEEN